VRGMTAVLQVALDMMHLKRALAIGREACRGRRRLVEVGTPLLRARGEAVERCGRRSPSAPSWPT